SKNFDARQKIGVSDARQRLGGGTGKGFHTSTSQIEDNHLGHQTPFTLSSGFQVKDAREKLVQKDARFKIRGRGGSGAVQDARQMINSRKQGQSQFGTPAQTTLKAAIAQQLQSKMPVPQIQSNSTLASANPRLFTTNVQGLNTRVSTTPQLSNNVRVMDARDRLSLKRSIGGTQAQAAAEPALKITKTIQIPSKQIKITTANNMLQSRSMTAPITKVVKNDAYTAPRPPVPVVPTRPNTSTAAASSSAPTFSPLEGTKITVNNLHPRVSEEDIVELFCVCGALKRARLVKVGVAEVVFVRKEDAVSAYRKYNNRCLDQPMKCNLHIQGSVITSDQPILRLSDTPGAGGSVKKDGLPPSLSRPSGQRASSQPTAEVDPQTILKALFKSTTQSTSTTEAPSSQTTAFRIKI
uniref:DNA polymerase delta interacting protein 3 n=1 Tax=Fundulus heteroclitus TaxID=8078 RepID=A0A3Q2QDL0_FUNHE